MQIPVFLQQALTSIGGKSVLIQNLWICGALLLLLTVFQGLFQFLKGKWSAQASENMAKRLREKLYDHLQHLPYSYHVKAETGDLVQRCTSDVDTVRRFLAVQLVEIVNVIVMVSIAATIMFSIHVELAIISLISVPILLSFAFYFFMKVKAGFQISDEAEGALTTAIQENVTGARVVKAFGMEQHEIELFEEKNVDYRDKTYNLIKLLAWFWSSSDFISFTQIVVVLSMGTYFAVHNEITVGTLVVFVTYEVSLLWPVRQLGRILTELGKTLVSVQRINEILTEPIEQDVENAFMPAISGNISYENVSFSYQEGRTILSDISFEVKRGQTVGIIGATGSGKSTLMYLLTRLYEPTQGKIVIDGVDIATIKRKWLRKHLSIVLQEPFLYSRSIKENIALARLSAKEEEIQMAAQIASVHEVIMSFSDGYDTAVGEKGVTLSGGQKQRVAISRSLLLESPVVILDDSLSAVDMETEQKILRGLKERLKETTTFLITHRITALTEADQILVMDKGKIVQRGTYRELIETEGLFHRLYDLQNDIEKQLQIEMETETKQQEMTVENDFVEVELA